MKAKYERLRKIRVLEAKERVKSQRERIEKQRIRERRRGWERQPAFHDYNLTKRIARTERWDNKWEWRRAKLERKRRIKELFAQWREAEKKKAEEERARVGAIVKDIKEASKAPVFVPETMERIDKTLDDADAKFAEGRYYKAIELLSLVDKLSVKAKEDTLKRMREEWVRIRKEEPGRYLYCVIPFSGETSFGDIGLNNSEVFSFPFRDLSAVVSPSPVKDYDLTEENTRKHEEAIRKIMDEFTVIPAEFGTTIKSEMILKNLMTKAYKTIKECTKLVDNKMELGVKVVLKKDTALPPNVRDEYVSDISESLNAKAEQMTKGDLFSNRLVLNSSFLVERERLDEFSEEVERLQRKYGDQLDFLYSGPWAPYSFIYIRIGEKGMAFERGRKR